METAMLDTPKAGKSRFSKALPAPPAFLKSLKGLPSSPQPPKNHLPPARKPLPAMSAELPSLPRKESSPSPASPSSTTTKPLDSPLPPVPLNSLKASAPLPSIPRRPVAAGSPGLSSADDSPLSSLLSAYTDSNRSSDATHLSSRDGSTPASSARESYQVSPKPDSSPFTAAASSPKLDELFFTPLSIHPAEKATAPNRAERQQVQRSAENSIKQLPLPPVTDLAIEKQTKPTKEQTPSSAISPTPVLTHNAPRSSPDVTLAQTPNSNPQIWRRRSVKAETNLAVTELKLVSSNGSTTSVSSVSAPEPPPKEGSPILLLPGHSTAASGAAAPTRSPLPTPNAAFPGRNIRPVGSRQELVDTNAVDMGQEVSRVKHALKRADCSETGIAGQGNAPSPPRRASPPSVNAHSKNASISSPVRLPTPEYDTDDFKGPIVETIVSPVSPASSPDLPSEPRPQRRVQETPDVQPTKGSSTSATQPIPGGLGVRAPVGLPSSPAASRTGPPTPQSQFPARTTSKAPVRSPVPEQKPASASPGLHKGRTVSEVGSIETIKAPRQEQFLPALGIHQTKEEAHDEDTTDHPGAQRFPRGWKTEVAKDTVFQPPPISEKHHRCMMRHRVMHESRNMYYPLACQACHVKDTSWRYVCSCCNLRVCKSCRVSLRKYNGDLRALMRHNDSVIVEQSTELEYDDEEAAVQSERASAAQSKASSQTALVG